MINKKRFVKSKKFEGKMKNKNFKSKKNVASPSPAEHLTIDNIDLSKKSVALQAKVVKVIQTGGPTIFLVSDGTGTLALKGFIKPGERAYPEINEEDIIKAKVSIDEFQGELEGNIKNVLKIEGEEKKLFEKKLEKIEFERAKVKAPKFLVQDVILEKLREKFIEAATHVRLAVIQNRPIIVRHHNDADGYSSGFALERAIIPLIEDQHNSAKAAWEYFIRAPCQAPFYEIDDSIRDTANSLRNAAKFSNKMPLIIIADNGSSPEDLMAIKQAKIHGADFIVIDHHGFDKDVISEEVLTHINPFLVEEEGSKFSAGMLCSELARFINPNVKNISQIPAMAGFADKIDLMNPEVMNQYLLIAQKEGYSKQLLADIALMIDYVSAKVRFMEAREYVEVLFGEPREKQKRLVELMVPYIRELDRKGLEIGKSNSKINKIGETTLQSVEVEETFPGFGFFPKPGRAVSLIHDNFQNEKKISNLVTIGLMNTAMTIRATDEANFSVHDLKKYIQQKLPDAFVEGGGHKNAGSLSFLPYMKEDIFKCLKEFIKSRQ